MYNKNTNDDNVNKDTIIHKNTKNDNVNKDGDDKDKKILEAEKIAIEGIMGIFMVTISTLKEKKL